MTSGCEDFLTRLPPCGRDRVRFGPAISDCCTHISVMTATQLRRLRVGRAGDSSDLSCELDARPCDYRPAAGVGRGPQRKPAVVGRGPGPILWRVRSGSEDRRSSSNCVGRSTSGETPGWCGALYRGRFTLRPTRPTNRSSDWFQDYLICSSKLLPLSTPACPGCSTAIANGGMFPSTRVCAITPWRSGATHGWT